MPPPGVRIVPDQLLDPVRNALPPGVAQAIAADQGVKAFRRTSRFRSCPGLHESWKSGHPDFNPATVSTYGSTLRLKG